MFWTDKKPPITKNQIKEGKGQTLVKLTWNAPNIDISKALPNINTNIFSTFFTLNTLKIENIKFNFLRGATLKVWD